MSRANESFHCAFESKSHQINEHVKMLKVFQWDATTQRHFLKYVCDKLITFLPFANDKCIRGFSHWIFERQFCLYLFSLNEEQVLYQLK